MSARLVGTCLSPLPCTTAHGTHPHPFHCCVMQVLILSFSKAAAKSIQARAAALLSSHYSTRGATEQECVIDHSIHMYSI